MANVKTAAPASWPAAWLCANVPTAGTAPFVPNPSINVKDNRVTMVAPANRDPDGFDASVPKDFPDQTVALTLTNVRRNRARAAVPAKMESVDSRAFVRTDDVDFDVKFVSEIY